MPRRRDRLIVGLALVLACGCRQVPGSAPPGKATPRDPSVLLITVDTLRADAVGAYGSPEAGTPTLDSLASQGTVFERAYAAAPITLTSHATLLTGLYPPGHAARHNGLRMRDGVATLAERFRAANARTAAFVSAYPLDASFGLARGFDRYSDRMPRGADGRLASERPGRATVDEAVAWLRDRRGERFFAWVHLFEPHAPYGNPLDRTPARNRYAAEVREADRQIARLLDSLHDGRADTIVLASSDHGEAFGEHGEVTHSLFVYDTTVRVPLIVAGPGVPEGLRVAGVVSLVDVAPTLVGLAGLPVMDTDGVDLREVMAGAREMDRTLYAESFAPLLDFGWGSLRSVRLGRWKYIAAPRPELYDLQADPAEERNVVAQHQAQAMSLASLVAKTSGPELPAATGTSDPEALRRLQALGYASGAPRGAAGERRDPKDGRALAAEIATVVAGELHGAALDAALESILRRDPGNPQAALRLGFSRIAAGRCREAEDLLGRAIAREIPGSDPWLGLATCQGRRGAVQEALKSLEAARAREPRNAVVLANIGIARSRLGDPAGASAALSEALQLDSGLHEARFNLALVHARAGRREAARRETEELLRRLAADAPQRKEVERLLQTLR